MSIYVAISAAQGKVSAAVENHAQRPSIDAARPADNEFARSVTTQDVVGDGVPPPRNRE